MNNGLPDQNFFIVVGGVDESFQQMDGRYADDGRGQFHFQHRGVHMAEPLGLVWVLFKVHARDKSFITTDDDHDQQVGDHHHIDQGQHHQHDDGFIQADHRRVSFIANAIDQCL